MKRLSGVKRWLQDDHGAQVAEFAILLPILLMLVFGIIDFGRGFFSWVILTNGAREGARAAAVGNNQAAVTSTVQNAVSGLYVTGIESGACVSPAKGKLCVTGANLVGDMGEPVTVTVQYNFSYIVLPNIMNWAAGSSMPGGVFPLVAHSTMRLE